MRRSRSSHPSRAVPVAPAGIAPATLRSAGALVVAVVTLALGAYALIVHRIGDYLTESDFYAGYAIGARALQHGHVDFARYGVYGPVYEVMLALFGWALPDLFTAARVLSVLAAGATLWAWWRVAERRLDSAVALLLVVALLANPTLMRYGYSATTDMVAMAWFSLSVCATLTVAGRRGPLAAGVAAGLAVLTRYNLASLLPAALLFEGLRSGRSTAARAGHIALFLLGMLIPIAPWTAASLHAGHLPGETLIRDRGFYLQGTPGQLLESRYRDLGADVRAQAQAEAQSEVGATAALPGLGARIGEHVLRDARDLLGPPIAILAIAGVIAILILRAGAPFVPLLPFALCTALVLLPVFYTERYSMVLAPMWTLPAAWLVARIARARWPRPWPLLAAATLGLAALIPTVRWAIVYHRGCAEILPLETRVAGAALRAVARPGERLLARKAHTAYYAGLQPVPFPIYRTLPSLAAYCRAQDVHYLYYSWYEAYMRPAFAFLLDTSAVVPGLEVVNATAQRPSVTFRVTPDFGRTPAWWEDGPTRERLALRVNALLLPGAAATPHLVRLAAIGLERGRPAEALRDAEAALRLDPGEATARQLRDEARSRLARPAAPAAPPANRGARRGGIR